MPEHDNTQVPKRSFIVPSRRTYKFYVHVLSSVRETIDSQGRSSRGRAALLKEGRIRVKSGDIELQIYKGINPNVLSSVYIGLSYEIEQRVFFIHGPRNLESASRRRAHFCRFTSRNSRSR